MIQMFCSPGILGLENATAFCSPDGTLEWGCDRYQRDMFVTGFQVSAVARNACRHQRVRHCIIPIQQG